VCKIFIDGAPNSLLEELGMTSEPFPALIELDLSSRPFWEDPRPFPNHSWVNLFHVCDH
jgi:hypothetical protein